MTTLTVREMRFYILDENSIQTVFIKILNPIAFQKVIRGSGYESVLKLTRLCYFTHTDNFPFSALEFSSKGPFYG